MRPRAQHGRGDDRADAGLVRREAEAALESVRRGSPFGDAWTCWSPDASADMAELPAGWDAPAADLPPLR